MPQHLASKQATGLTALVHWHIDTGTEGGADIYALEFDNGRCRTCRGAGAGEPQLTITLDAAEFVRLATGNSNPMQGYSAPGSHCGATSCWPPSYRRCSGFPAAAGRVNR